MFVQVLFAQQTGPGPVRMGWRVREEEGRWQERRPGVKRRTKNPREMSPAEMAGLYRDQKLREDKQRSGATEVEDGGWQKC